MIGYCLRFRICFLSSWFVVVENHLEWSFIDLSTWAHIPDDDQWFACHSFSDVIQAVPHLEILLDGIHDRMCLEYIIGLDNKGRAIIFVLVSSESRTKQWRMIGHSSWTQRVRFMFEIGLDCLAWFYFLPRILDSNGRETRAVLISNDTHLPVCVVHQSVSRYHF
jgi:hypothetical protein